MNTLNNLFPPEIENQEQESLSPGSPDIKEQLSKIIDVAPEIVLEEPPRKKRGRKKKDEEPLTSPIATEALEQFCIAISKLFASRAGEKWVMTQEEAQKIALPLDRCLVKYLPVVAGYSEELALGLALSVYVFARIDVSELVNPAPKKVERKGGVK